MNTRPKRMLKEYQRYWNNLNVDKNLKDDWLIKLNSLRAFNLISICEGHIDSKRYQKYPHVYLRIKSNFILQAREIMYLGVDNVLKLNHMLFNTNLCKIRLNSSRCIVNDIIRDDFTICIDSNINVDIAPFSEIEQWFENIIEQIIKYDSEFIHLLT